MTLRKSSNISKYDMRTLLRACLEEADRVYQAENGWFILKQKQHGGGHNNTRCDPKVRGALERGFVRITSDRRVRTTSAGQEWLNENG